LPSVENAPIRLRALNLQDAYMSKNEMVSHLLSFIMSQIGDQVIGVVGSLDILGNPINMFGNIGEGIYDLFYEPAKGITLGAKEFGYGLGKGSKSLAKKTVYGVSDATTKITSSVSHGVAALSMDRDYQRKRRAERLGHQPSNALKGLGYGLKDFSTGIVRGITGLVEQPIKGGREEGPKGVAKGVGKGLAG
jgi:vacuolar protein sorting-associated protein 13A/C